MSVYMLWFSFIHGLNFTFLCFKLIVILYYTDHHTLLYRGTKIKKS